MMQILVNYEDIPFNLTLTTGNNPAAKKIHRLGSDDDNVSLGVQIAPSRDQDLKVDFQRSEKQSSLLSVHANTTKISPMEM